MISNFTAVVLAAGRSSRMGRDKALLTVGGVPLWWRQCALLRAAGAETVVLSLRQDQPWSVHATGPGAADRVVFDAKPDCGPLGGIVAAWDAVGDVPLAVLAVDLPRMEANWFSHLSAVADEGTGVVGRRAGYFEPLAALYPGGAAASARAALAAGRLSLQEWVRALVAAERLRVYDITPTEAALFENWNEPSPRA